MRELQEQENQTIIVYATFPNLAEAEEISSRLVEEKLVACVNLFPGMISLYRWDETIQRESEVAAIFKTRQQFSDALVQRIETLHSYDVPAILVLPSTGGSAGYRDWINRMTDAATTSGMAAG